MFQNGRCTASYFVKIIWCSRWFCKLPPHLRQCIALFAVAEGWLLLNIGRFVLFLIVQHKHDIKWCSNNSMSPCLARSRWYIFTDIVEFENTDTNSKIFTSFHYYACRINKTPFIFHHQMSSKWKLKCYFHRNLKLLFVFWIVLYPEQTFHRTFATGAYTSEHLVLSHLGLANVLIGETSDTLDNTFQQLITYLPDLTYYRFLPYYSIQVS